MKDNKIYIKDVKENDEILKKILENNESFKNTIWEDYFDYCMRAQEDEFYYMFGQNWRNYIDIKDNYNSFYLRLKNCYEFFKNLDSGYLYGKGLILYQDLSEKFEKIEYLSESEEEEFESQCVELLEICENQLHRWENLKEEDMVEYFLEEIQQGYFENLYYYKDKNDYILYEDISYTKCWN